MVDERSGKGMSVLIKNMEMPKTCWGCQFGDDCGETVHCNITGESQIADKRHDCPLIEIPPHGDLIDRWELTETAMIDPDEGKYVAVYRADEVDEAPVVIEAEGRE